MSDLLDLAYAAALVVALGGTGLALGMRHDPASFVAVLSHRRYLGCIALVDVVAVPLIVWILVQVFAVPDDYAIGLLLVGMASAGPLGIKAAQLANADVQAAVVLVVALEFANLAAIPLWVALLLPDGTEVSRVDVLATVLVAVVLPLVGGFAYRRWAPNRAVPVARALTTASNVAVIAIVALVLIRDADTVAEAARARVPFVAVLTVVTAFGLAWAAGGASLARRSSAALVTAVRASGPALAIAAAAFPGRPEVRAGIVVFALFSITLPLLAAVSLRRRWPPGSADLHARLEPTVAATARSDE